MSLVTHGALFGLLFLSVRHVTVVQQRPLDLVAIRLLNVHQEQAALHWVPPKSLKASIARAAQHAIRYGGGRGAAPATRTASVPPKFQLPTPAQQTLIQPDVPPTTKVLPMIPVPQAVVWTAGEIAQRKIVPPTPKPLGAIQVHPLPSKPNPELAPAEVSLTSTPFQTKAPMPAPGTTMPIVVSGPQPAKQMPQTASTDKGPATASRVISLSNLKLQSGNAALPAINEVAPTDTTGLLTPGETATVSRGNGAPGNGSYSINDGSGSGHANGNGGDNGQGVVVEDGSAGETADNGNGGNANGQGITVFDGSGNNSIDGASGPPQHITLPPNGQYGVVVVGASPQENYPQTVGLWAGRMVYTVYLQTDTPQNWILQYSLPREADPPGVGAQLDAPWPYDMMRPNLGRYDIVLVHGYVSADGRFDGLSVAYPPGFGKAEMLLRNLKSWDFRPAMLNGLATKVEVLLIIPGLAQ